MIRFSVLASSSKGNCVFVEAGATRLLLDAGISFKRIKEGCSILGVNIKTSIDAVFISHEHSDHNRAYNMLKKNTLSKIYRPEGMKHDNAINVKDVKVTPFCVQHDKDMQCFGFCVQHNLHKLVYISDFACLPETSWLIASNPSILIIEYNYDEEMLLDSPYTQDMIERIVDTHCMNSEATEITKALGTDKLKFLVPFHISENNNDPELVKKMAKKAIKDDKTKIWLATTNGWQGKFGCVI